MLIRTAFGAGLVLATALLFDPRVRQRLERPEADHWLRALFVGSRLGGWFVAYVVLADLTRFTDLVLYYGPEARQAYAGALPYVDFATSYGPLFPYVSGALLWIWNSQAAVALMLVLIEILAVLVLASTVKGDDSLPSGASTWTLAIYTLNPAALYWSGMMAYNSSIILLCWVIAARLLLRDRYAASTAWLAVSVAAGKFLGVLAAPVWAAQPRRRYGVMLLAGASAIALWAVGRRYGVDLALPLVREGGRTTAGNLWFLAGVALSATATDSALWRLGPVALLGLVAAALMVWLARGWREAPALRQLCGALSAMGWLFLITSKKSFPHYAPMFLLFTVVALCVAPAPRRRWALLLAIVGAVGIIEPGLWNALGQPASLGQVPALTGNAAALVVSDLMLVVGGARLAMASASCAVES